MLHVYSKDEMCRHSLIHGRHLQPLLRDHYLVAFLRPERPDSLESTCTILTCLRRSSAMYHTKWLPYATWTPHL